MPSAIYREVKQFQEDLKKAGVYGGEITGRYDDATHEAVKALMASGKLGDPVPIPNPAEDVFGSVIAAVAEEMKFSPTSAEAVRTAYSEYARKIQATVTDNETRRPTGATSFPPQARPQILEGVGDMGADFSVRKGSSATFVRGSAVTGSGVQELKKRLAAWGFFAGPTDNNNYGIPLEQAFQKFAKSKGMTVERLLAGGFEPMLQLTPAAVADVRAARQAAVQAVASAFQSLGPQGQAVVVLQLLMKKAGLYAGPSDGKYTAAVETGFQAWATRMRTTVEAYLASPGQSAVKSAVAAARAAAGFGGAGAGAAGAAGMPSQKAIYALQILLKKGGYISGEPDGVYEFNLETAFGNWAIATKTTIEAFLSTKPGPLKIGIKQARDAYLAGGGQAYSTGTGEPAQQETAAQETAASGPAPVPGPAAATAPAPAPMPEGEAAPEMAPPEEVAPPQAIVPVAPAPAEVKTEAAPKRSKWGKWLIYGTIVAAIGGTAWWYWKKRKAAAAMMDIDDGDGGEGEGAMNEEGEGDVTDEGCPCARKASEETVEVGE